MENKQGPNDGELKVVDLLYRSGSGAKSKYLYSNYAGTYMPRTNVYEAINGIEWTNFVHNGKRVRNLYW